MERNARTKWVRNERETAMYASKCLVRAQRHRTTSDPALRREKSTCTKLTILDKVLFCEGLKALAGGIARGDEKGSRVGNFLSLEGGPTDDATKRAQRQHWNRHVNRKYSEMKHSLLEQGR